MFHFLFASLSGVYSTFLTGPSMSKGGSCCSTANGYQAFFA